MSRPLQDLGIHSEMVSDGVIDLMEEGVVTNRLKVTFLSRVVDLEALSSSLLSGNHHSPDESSMIADDPPRQVGRLVPLRLQETLRLRTRQSRVPLWECGVSFGDYCSYSLSDACFIAVSIKRVVLARPGSSV